MAEIRKSQYCESLIKFIRGCFITILLLWSLSYASTIKQRVQRSSGDPHQYPSIPQAHDHGDMEYTTCAEVCEYNSILQKADCSGISLDSIPSSTGCENSMKLFLQENNIKNISDESLWGYDHLETLDMSDNELCNIHPGSFNNTEHLRILLLDGNNLRTLDSHTFVGATHLQRVRFMRNKIETIGNNAFNGVNQLVEIYASDNEIQQLPPTVFHGLNKLKTLYLDNNVLDYLSNLTFKGLVQLESLSLQGNKLTYLPLGLFEGLNSLRHVVLSNNELNDLPTSLMLGITSIIYEIYFDHNNLTLCAPFISYLDNIHDRLVIGHNPLKCDCGFTYIQEWYHNNTQEDFFGHSVLCSHGNSSYGLNDLLRFNCTDDFSKATQSLMTTAVVTSSPSDQLPVTDEVKTSNSSKNDESVNNCYGWKISSIVFFLIIILQIIVIIILVIYLKKQQGPPKKVFYDAHSNNIAL